LINQGVLGKIFSLFYDNINVLYCYNPIPKPKIKAYSKDINKLIFFSSPNKGLDQVLHSFAKISKELPQLKLYIANPGYKNKNYPQQESTVILGSLSHEEMMKHVSESLCVFYPQDTFAETFGLIYAEANAYGVPVLAHDIGAAKEILDRNNPLTDAKNINEIINLLKYWQKNYPIIRYNEKFSSVNILKQWSLNLEKRSFPNQDPAF
jgi:glycosyltransferase involved in cell wall biosynthesis